MNRRRVKSRIELMSAGDGRIIIRTPHDFIYVTDIDAGEIEQLIDALDASSTFQEAEANFPKSAGPLLRELATRLWRSFLVPDFDETRIVSSIGRAEALSNGSRKALPIAVLGNGVFAQTLRDRLRKSVSGDADFIHVKISASALGESFAQRSEQAVLLPFTRKGVGQSADLCPDQTIEDLTPSSIVGVTEGYRLIICAFEDTFYRVFRVVGDALEAAGIPALFLTSGLGNAILGPLTIPGVTASFADAYSALLRQTAPDLADEGYVDFMRSHTSEAAEGEALAAQIVEEIRSFVEAPTESLLFGHLVELKSNGETSRLAPVLRRTASDPRAAQRTEEQWPELHHAAVLRLAVTDAACTSHRSDRQIPSTDSEIRRICIVGGGTAGYLTALTLRKRLPHLEVALLESSKVPIIGVGEATTPSLPALLHGVLGIDITEFFEAVRPTFKLGIKFEWGGKTPEHYFNYPFGAHGRALEAYTYDGHILNYSLQSMLMSADTVPIFKSGDGIFESRLHFGTISYAYHIDNKRFVECLHREAARAGVRRIDATIEKVELNETGTQVEALLTDDGQRHRFDFYVDCSGFRSLLLGEALGSKWRSYGDTLLTNRAVVANVPHGGHIKPYTTAQTMQHGWCWNIPLPDSDHRGYVYSSAFCSDEEAEAEMRGANPTMGDARIVRFVSGRREEFWKGNVAAIGNSYAFVEPLESTGVHMIIEEIVAFVSMFPSSAEDDANRRSLNRYLGEYWDELRWFLALHFHFNTKYDTPFWRANREETDVSGLEDTVGTYKESAPLSYRNHFLKFDRLWGDHGRDILLMGQEVPARFLPPRDSREQWEQRVRLSRSAVELAIPQAEALDLLRANPHVLRHLVENNKTWLQAVGGLFKRSTGQYHEIRHARQGRMNKPRDASLDQNVLLPETAVG